MTNPIIHWFRRDLRINDNTALHHAVKTGLPIIPLFIFDPAILQSPNTGALRLNFMLTALESLDQSLRDYGGQLIIRHGDPQHVLSRLVSETGATELYYNRDYTPFALKRDKAIASSLPIPVHSFDDALLVPPGDVLKSDGEPFKVFTPFKKRWDEIDKPVQYETDFRGVEFAEVVSEIIPELDDLGKSNNIAHPPATEVAAIQRLQSFISSNIHDYSSGRNGLTIDPYASNHATGPSHLSHYFRLGLLSPREAYWHARDAYTAMPIKDKRDSVATWVSELTWREFYMHIMYHFPHVTRYNFRREFDSFEWRESPEDLQRWKDGMTGYPLVDAAMRQLNQIGWLPNRARMVVASFLTKHLLIDWRHGERYFMQKLIDGDPAANNGGWQWAAGTGTDANPFFRIFNPILQSKKFDPEGEYIRHWVPELRRVATPDIHTPWEIGRPIQGYPEPIVEHSFARQRALDVFSAFKSPADSM